MDLSLPGSIGQSGLSFRGRFTISDKPALIAAMGGSAGVTVLRREIDGTVTVVFLATPWAPTLSRQNDGSVTVAG